MISSILIDLDALATVRRKEDDLMIGPNPKPWVIRPAYHSYVTDWEKPSVSGWSYPGQTVLLSVSPYVTWRRMADFIYSFSEDPVVEKVILCVKRFYLLLRHDLWAEQGPETITNNLSWSWGCWCVSFLFSSPWVVSSPRVVDLGSSTSSNYKCAVNYIPLCLPRYLIVFIFVSFSGSDDDVVRLVT